MLVISIDTKNRIIRIDTGIKTFNFDESKVKRNKDGQFASKDGGGKSREFERKPQAKGKVEDVSNKDIGAEEKAVIKNTLNQRLGGKKIVKGSKITCSTANYTYIVEVIAYGAYKPKIRKEIP